MGNPFSGMSPEEKKFIPCNIVAIVLGLVAAFTLLFAPLITIDVGKIFSSVTEAVGEMSDKSQNNDDSQNNDVDNENSDNGNSSGNSGSDAAAKEMLSVIADVMNLKINITVVGLGKAATSSNPMGSFVSSMLPDKSLEDMALSIMANIAAKSVVGADLDANIDKKQTKAVTEALRKAENGDKEGAKADMNAAMKDIASSLGKEWTTETEDTFNDFFDGLMEKGTKENGDFSLEYMLVTTVAEQMEIDKEITTYKELKEELTGSMMSDGAMGDTMGTANKMMKTGLLSMFLMSLFPALMWFLLAILACVHLFLKNKTFRTWYVMVFGGLPCLFCGVMPLVVGKIIASKVPGGIGKIFTAIGSTTWVSGACWLALLIFGIAYMYRARSKARP